MRALKLGVMMGCAVALLATVVGAQGIQCALQKAGALVLSTDGQKLGMLELNAHGPEWKYVSQTEAMAEAKNTEDDKGKVLTGRLPVPNTEGGAVTFIETVVPGDNKLDVTYDLSFDQAMTLNGLQVSLVLPAKRYAGKPVTLRMGEGERNLDLAMTLNRDLWELITVKGDQVRIASDTPDQITITTDQEADIGVKDLRRWDRDEFEVRIALITEQQGRQVSAADSFKIKLSLEFGGAVELTGP